MGNAGEALTGFSWRGGIERDTTGILMWSQPYIVTLPDTQEEVYTCVLYRTSVCIYMEMHTLAKKVHRGKKER